MAGFAVCLAFGIACAAPAGPFVYGADIADASPDGVVDSGAEEEDVSGEDSPSSDGDDSSETALDGDTVLDASSPRTVAGSVSYEDRVYAPTGFTGELAVRPARSVFVAILDADSGATIAETWTDGEGAFAVKVEAPSETLVRVRAEARVHADGLVAFVTEAGVARKPYAMLSEPFVVDEELDVVLVATRSGAVGGAMNIADVAGEGLRYARTFADDAAPPLAVRWSPGVPFGCGSCFVDGAILLGGHPDDPDEYDDDIILHEVAHYLVHHFGHDDSPGGTHRDLRVAPTLAYGEGLAYFLASAIRDTPLMVDNFAHDVRLIDYEHVVVNGESGGDLTGTGDGTDTGLLREEIVAGILWDARDAYSDDEPWDRIELGEDLSAALLRGFGSALRADRGATGVDLVDLLALLHCMTGDGSAVEALALDRAFPWSAPETPDCPP